MASADIDGGQLVPLLTRLGEQLSFETAFEQSRETLTQALDLARTRLRPGHPDVAELLRLLASPHEGLGDVVSAKAFRTQALAAAEEAYGFHHPVVAMALNDLALSSMKDGDYVGGRRLSSGLWPSMSDGSVLLTLSCSPASSIWR